MSFTPTVLRSVQQTTPSASYRISYTPNTYINDKWHPSENNKTRYDEWQSNGMPPAIFKYSEHLDCNSINILEIYFNQIDELIYINGDFEHSEHALVCKLMINCNTKTIKIEKILCKNTNHWPDVFSLNSECGGISYYKSNVKYLGYNFSIEYAIEKFFGTTWNLIIPLTVPRISDETFEITRNYIEEYEFDNKENIEDKKQFYINEHIPERINDLLMKSLRDIAINIGINPHQTKSELREQIQYTLKI